VVGRYGGEEFMIILANTELKTASQIAERVRARIAASPVNIHSQLINMTISIGVTGLREEDDFRSLVRRADEALYAAKGSGRNCIIER
jgi:diguanylate cyclase (GGDEF)-like protein